MDAQFLQNTTVLSEKGYPMTKIITYCDHCGKVLNDMDDYGGSQIEIAYFEIEADLCKQCHGQLVKTVKDFCNHKERNSDA